MSLPLLHLSAWQLQPCMANVNDKYPSRNPRSCPSRLYKQLNGWISSANALPFLTTFLFQVQSNKRPEGIVESSSRYQLIFKYASQTLTFNIFWVQSLFLSWIIALSLSLSLWSLARCAMAETWRPLDPLIHFHVAPESFSASASRVGEGSGVRHPRFKLFSFTAERTSW